MPLEEVNTTLARIALDNCEGFPFEEFINDFFAAIEGVDFLPIGGTADGGADGAYEQGLYSRCDKLQVFYQVSTQKNYSSKIKKSVARLREFGREPKTLIYVTSQVITTFDKAEEELTDELSIFIRIRDGKWILSHLNNNEATKKAYYTHLKRYTDFLSDLNNGNELQRNQNISHPSVYVFLQQQVENKTRDKHLIKTVADSLILWSLNDTNPDQNKFLTAQEILTFIKSNIPWAKNIVGGLLSNRLKFLSKKSADKQQKQINFRFIRQVSP